MLLTGVAAKQAKCYAENEIEQWGKEATASHWFW
jgi:hypothetical protein